jgi:hypothetical protein
LDPLFKEEQKVPPVQRHVRSKLPVSGTNDRVMRKATEVLPVLYEVTFGQRRLDIIPRAGRSAVVSLPPAPPLIPAPSPGASAQANRPMDDACDL